jgi:integrase
MKKLKISYKLKQSKGEESLIIMMVNFGYKEFDSLKEKHIYKPLKYYTGIKVKKGEWDNVSKVPKNKKALSEINALEQTVEKVFDYLTIEKKEITPTLLKEELDFKIKGKSDVKQRIRIVDFIDEVILKGNNRSEGTLKQYNGLSNKLQTFEKLKGRKINVDDIDENLYLEFKTWLQGILGRINSVWSVLKVLKAVLNEISRKYQIKVFDFVNQLSKLDKVSPVTEDKVFFNFSHIEKVIKYQPESTKLKNVKGILLTLLFTGCRYSDVFKIKPQHYYLDEDTEFHYARYVSEKTNTDIIVPILKPLSDFYKQNENQTPYPISDVKFNVYVKELIEAAEIDDEVTLSFTNSFGKKEYETKAFFKFVTSHIGRRSFITNLINYIPITILTKITGHKLADKNIIFGYNKISLEENSVLFVKELKRQMESNPKEFKIKLI